MITKGKVKKLKPVDKGRADAKKVVINTDILNTNYHHLENNVVYGVFKDDGDPAIVPKNVPATFGIEKHQSVCFANLLSMIKDSGSNRMFYNMVTYDPGSHYPDILTPEECVRWLTMAKEYKLLPPYINAKSVKESVTAKTSRGVFIIDLKDLTPSLLYIYLSTIRNIREDPGLPKAVIYLVDELGMNFYIAYTFASAVVMSTTGHHIMGGRQYGMRTSGDAMTSQEIEAQIKTPLGSAVGLQRLVNDPHKYDERDVLQAGYGFNCSTFIDTASKVNYKARLKELFDDDTIAAVMSKTDREANEYLNRLKSKGVGK